MKKNALEQKRMENLPPDSRKVYLTKVSTVNKAIDFFEHVCYND